MAKYMNFYIVVHHRKDSNQPWKNQWLDDNRIVTITTTRDIGAYCQNLIGTNRIIFVHRCAWGNEKPTICAEVQVEAADPIDKKTYLVRFKNQMVIDTTPPKNPLPGSNSYEA
jgi:hypothetical protein